MKTVLVVEDELNVRRELLAQLRPAFPDAEILEARTFEGASEKIRTVKQAGRTIDFGLVDLRLPRNGQSDIDGGFAVLEALQRDFPESQALVLSVRSDQEAEMRSNSMHTSLMLKPWNQEELLHTLKKSLSS